MWEAEERYSASIARTNKLWCSNCRRKIKKGENVVFWLDVDEDKIETMKEVYCFRCGSNYEHEVIMDSL